MPAVQSPPRPAARAPESPDASPYEEYRRRFQNGEKGNLIDGRAILDMSASIRHQLIERFLLILLQGYASEKGLGQALASRVLVRIDERNGFEPDVLFVRQDRLYILGERDVQGAPDLAVEIVSPSSRRDDRGAKFDGYERVGVPEYWLVDPERREASFYRLDGAPYEAGGAYRAVPLQDGQFVSEAVPGFRFDPQVLFADPLPREFAVLRALLREA